MNTDKRVPTVAIETHGCKLNQADSLELASEWGRAGFRLIGEDEPADVYVVNTCTVTHLADRKARQALRAARRRNAHATIVATGCYAERVPQLLQRMPEVDLAVGNRGKAGLVAQVIKERGMIPAVRAVGEEAPRDLTASTKKRPMVKIQEGCDQVCAYCIVPRVRGRERSVPPGDIVGRINAHVAMGHKEVVLTGTQLGSYGFDLPGMSLKELLRRILSEAAMLRLRVSSLQPQEIDSELLGLWSDRRLCPHFHLALQSGSDEVLRAMRRRYSARQYLEAAKSIREAVPGVAITSDVIAGFPGETQEQFQQTVGVCEDVGFAGLHVFPFSPRPGTTAAHLSGNVDAAIKSDRVRELISLSRRQSASFRRGLLRTTRMVLWEQRSQALGPDIWTGLTDNYIRVIAPSKGNLANTISAARLLVQREDLVVAQVL